jgi:hypothetical protein
MMSFSPGAPSLAGASFCAHALMIAKLFGVACAAFAFNVGRGEHDADADGGDSYGCDDEDYPLHDPQH